MSTLNFAAATYPDLPDTYLKGKLNLFVKGMNGSRKFLIRSKDIHVVPDCIGQVGEKSRKSYSDKRTEKEHIDDDVLPSEMKRRNCQTDTKKDEKKGGQSWRERCISAHITWIPSCQAEGSFSCSVHLAAAGHV